MKQTRRRAALSEATSKAPRKIKGKKRKLLASKKGLALKKILGTSKAPTLVALPKIREAPKKKKKKKKAITQQNISQLSSSTTYTCAHDLIPHLTITWRTSLPTKSLLLRRCSSCGGLGDG